MPKGGAHEHLELETRIANLEAVVVDHEDRIVALETTTPAPEPVAPPTNARIVIGGAGTKLALLWERQADPDNFEIDVDNQVYVAVGSQRSFNIPNADPNTWSGTACVVAVVAGLLSDPACANWTGSTPVLSPPTNLTGTVVGG